jgi:hypothetical protein
MNRRIPFLLTAVTAFFVLNLIGHISVQAQCNKMIQHQLHLTYTPPVGSIVIIDCISETEDDCKEVKFQTSLHNSYTTNDCKYQVRSEDYNLYLAHSVFAIKRLFNCVPIYTAIGSYRI